jgi:CheY-like chemotaxis protein
MKEVFSVVLLVDDDPVTRAINTMVIKDLGLTEKLSSAQDGRVGINALNDVLNHYADHERPVLVLLDLMMPVMDGFEFLEEFNKLQMSKSAVEICVLSSSVNQEDQKRVSKLGVCWYIEKPLTAAKMMKLTSLLSENNVARSDKVLKLL